MCLDAGLCYLLVIGVHLPEANALLDAHIEEHWFLPHIPDQLLSQLLQVEATEWLSSNQHTPFQRVIESEDELHDG